MDLIVYSSGIGKTASTHLEGISQIAEDTDASICQIIDRLKEKLGTKVRYQGYSDTLIISGLYDIETIRTILFSSTPF